MTLSTASGPTGLYAPSAFACAIPKSRLRGKTPIMQWPRSGQGQSGVVFSLGFAQKKWAKSVLGSTRVAKGWARWGMPWRGLQWLTRPQGLAEGPLQPRHTVKNVPASTQRIWMYLSLSLSPRPSPAACSVRAPCRGAGAGG